MIDSYWRRGAIAAAILALFPAAGRAQDEIGPCLKCDLLVVSTYDLALWEVDPDAGTKRKLADTQRWFDIALTPQGRLFGILAGGGSLHEIHACTGVSAPFVGSALLNLQPGLTGELTSEDVLGANTSLSRTDTVTGSVTSSGSGWCGPNWGDLAVHPGTGELYAVLQACGCVAGTMLVVIDAVTGDVVREVGCIPFRDVYGIGFDSSCRLWGGDDRTRQLIRIDPVTGWAWSVPIAGGFLRTYGIASVPCPLSPIGGADIDGILRVSKGAGTLEVEWSDVAAAAAGYHLSAGTIDALHVGRRYDHELHVCDVPRIGRVPVAGTVEVGLPPDDTYFLVAPADCTGEGRLGHDSFVRRRPRADPECGVLVAGN